MQDDGILEKEEQRQISSSADETHRLLSQSTCMTFVSIDRSIASSVIEQLHSNCAPGVDGVSAENLKAANGDVHCGVLSNLLSCVLSWQCVPSFF